uniref:Zinc finger containing preotein n=1 Tax=Solanum tuberosum TaxID=4113 RepID=M1AJ71_SOLTU
MSNLPRSELKQVVASSEFILLVYESGRRYIVRLERKTCNCGRFQLDAIPCAHAIAVLKSKNITDMHPHCSDYYIAVKI